MLNRGSIAIIAAEGHDEASAKARFSQTLGASLIGAYTPSAVIGIGDQKEGNGDYKASGHLLEGLSPEGVIILGTGRMAFETLSRAIDARITTLFERALMLQPEWLESISKNVETTGMGHRLFCFPTRLNAFARRTIRTALREGVIGRIVAADAINTTQQLVSAQCSVNAEVLNLWDYAEVFHDWVGPYRDLYASGNRDATISADRDDIEHIMVAGYLNDGALGVEYHSGASPLSRNHELITIYGSNGALRCDYAKKKAYIAERDKDFREIDEEDCEGDPLPEVAFADIVSGVSAEAGAHDAVLSFYDAVEIANKIKSIDGMVRSSPCNDLNSQPSQKRTIDKLAWIHIVDGKCLVTRSKDKLLWYIPGGKREENENDVEALLREIREELQVRLDPASISYVGAFHEKADGKPDGVVVKMSCYEANIASGELQADNEIEEYAWFSYAHLDKISAVDRVIFNYLNHMGRIK